MEGFIMNEKYRTEFLTMVNEFIQKIYYSDRLLSYDNIEKI